MIRTLRQTGLPFILCIVLAAILTAQASALEVKIGPVREQTIQWLMETRGLSRDSAEQMIRKYARRNRADIIDSYTLPDNAMADLVTIDPSKRGRDQVEYNGCVLLFSPGSEYGKRLWAEIEKMKGTPAYDYFMARFADAVKRGVFVHKLTEEQKDRLLHAAKGDGRY
ncbi:MAG: hypothetical protein FJX74_03765, partial [Armatimonadetes bacterium]|nr:hypothetical protein [Armatimonadota bacterium]